MPLEIERKFLVRGDGWRTFPSRLIQQAYLSRDTDRSVRVRVDGDQAWLTIKGPATGVTRPEFEYPVPLGEAADLLQLRVSGLIEKHRHVGVVGEHQWEVDVFLGANAGLVLAEIELDEEGEAFTRPDWLGEEVTHDPRYTNAALAQCPYADWPSA
jgi:adenylate cyclase